MELRMRVTCEPIILKSRLSIFTVISSDQGKEAALTEYCDFSPSNWFNDWYKTDESPNRDDRQPFVCPKALKPYFIL